MKEGWKYMKLGEIATEMYRGSGIRRDQITTNGSPCVRYGEIYTTYNYYFDKCVSHTEESAIAPKKYFEYGDILFAITGESVEEIGKSIAYLGNNKCLAGGDIIVMKHNQNPKYLAYALSTPNAIAQKGFGKTKLKVVHTNAPSLKSVSIPVPPLPEQQRIVSYLDAEFAKIEALKANAEKQLQAAKDLFQAALKELLTPKEGWKIVNIGDVFKSYSGGTPSKSHQEYYTNASIPWLNSGEVCQKYITSTTNFISELGLKNSSAKYFPINTVLIAMYGATAAQAGILKFKATSNQAVCGLLPTKEMIPEFVYYWFLHNKTEFASMAQGGAQPNLSQIKIKAMPIPIIEVEQQQSISDKLNYFEEKVKQLQTNYTETITLCNDLKQALLKKVFEEDG